MIVMFSAMYIKNFVYKRSSFWIVLRLISLDHVVRFLARLQLANVETQNSKTEKTKKEMNRKDVLNEKW